MAKAMANDPSAPAPIIIKRVRKHGHAHHGGSWKVAFADFATAMMAFFLLMWLMGSTTEEQKGAISEYFNNPSAIAGASPVPAPTPVNGPGGASTSLIQLGGAMELHRSPAAAAQPAEQSESAAEATAAQIAANEEMLDQQRLDNLLEQLEAAIDQRESLAKFKDQILLDITPEGVRIQIIDHERRQMFPLGSARLETFTREILVELAKIIDTVPNRISISGHTDIKAYGAPNASYTNWELSADRANAARRALLGGGLPQEKVGRVIGLASSVLLDPSAPDSPVNRRISIVVMNKRTEAEISQDNGLLSMQPPVDDGTASADPHAAIQIEPPPNPQASLATHPGS
jgi:chemotaxis protein MotB